MTLSEVRSTYRDHLKRDFPDAERKPLAMIERSLRKGRYLCLGAFDGDEMTGYAFFVFEGDSCLLDYFAVLSGRRGLGYGSRFIKDLIPMLSRFETVIIEIENPAYAPDPESRSEMERRKAFYLNCGIKNTGASALVFGVEYLLLEFPPAGQHSPDDIARSYGAIYRSILPSVLYRKNILIRT